MDDSRNDFNLPKESGSPMSRADWQGKPNTDPETLPATRYPGNFTNTRETHPAGDASSSSSRVPDFASLDQTTLTSDVSESLASHLGHASPSRGPQSHDYYESDGEQPQQILLPQKPWLTVDSQDERPATHLPLRNDPRWERPPSQSRFQRPPTRIPSPTSRRVPIRPRRPDDAGEPERFSSFRGRIGPVTMAAPPSSDRSEIARRGSEKHDSENSGPRVPSSVYSQGSSRHPSFRSSRHSSASMTSLPPYPPPPLPPPPGRRPSLGPPPSARRVHSLYYPPTLPVMPIAEESDHDSNDRGDTRTIASVSSHASHDTGVLGHPDNLTRPFAARRVSPLAPAEPSSAENTLNSFSTISPLSQQPRHSAIDENSLNTSAFGSVRQASVGRRSKPTLVPVHRREGSRDGPTPQTSQTQMRSDEYDPESNRSTTIRRSWSGNSRARHLPRRRASSGENASRQNERGKTDSQALPEMDLPQEDTSFAQTTWTTSIRSGDAPSGQSSEQISHSLTMSALDYALALEGATPMSVETTVETGPGPVREQIAEGLQRGAALRVYDDHPVIYSDDHPVIYSVPEQDPVGDRYFRPASPTDGTIYFQSAAPADGPMNEGNTAAIRGSTTSLPGLIRRATRLATNLDRGRTSSRLGHDWLGVPDLRGFLSRSSRHSVVEMVSPSASPVGTPSLEAKSSGFINWGFKESVTKIHPGRCGCGWLWGLPLWVQLLMAIIAIIVVALAIILPLAFIVVPRQAAEEAASQTSLVTCAHPLPCQNAGVNILGTNGVCECLCINGFSGANCSQGGQVACTTIAISSGLPDTNAVENVTVGDQIAPVLDTAGSVYGISLNVSILLDLFAGLNWTCIEQNTLVWLGDEFPLSRERRWLSPAARSLQKRAELPRDVSSSLAPLSTSSASTPSPTTLSISLTPAASSNSSLSIPATRQPTTFSQTAILFILQSTLSLSAAETAQSAVGQYLADLPTNSSLTSTNTLATSATPSATTSGSTPSSTTPTTVDLGGGWSADFSAYMIKGPNGGVFGRG